MEKKKRTSELQKKSKKNDNSEVMENFGLTYEEKKLVLFLHKKNKLILIQ